MRASHKRPLRPFWSIRVRLRQNRLCKHCIGSGRRNHLLGSKPRLDEVLRWPIPEAESLRGKPCLLCLSGARDCASGNFTAMAGPLRLRSEVWLWRPSRRTELAGAHAGSGPGKHLRSKSESKSAPTLQDIHNKGGTVLESERGNAGTSGLQKVGQHMQTVG